MNLSRQPNTYLSRMVFEWFFAPTLLWKAINEILHLAEKFLQSFRTRFKALVSNVSSSEGLLYPKSPSQVLSLLHPTTLTYICNLASHFLITLDVIPLTFWKYALMSLAQLSHPSLNDLSKKVDSPKVSHMLWFILLIKCSLSPPMIWKS